MIYELRRIIKYTYSRLMTSLHIFRVFSSVWQTKQKCKFMWQTT